MKKFIIYKEYDPQQEKECMRCFIGSRDDYENRKSEILEMELEIYNDCGEELKTDEEYEMFLKTLESQLKLKCGFKK